MISRRQPRTFAHLAQRLFNVPLMLTETKAEIICAALQQRLGIAHFDKIDGTVLGATEMQSLASDARRSHGDDWKIFPMDAGIAVIQIDGTLVHKSGWVDPFSGMTGYDGIARKFRAAMADPDVKAIWLDIDSPGGETAGCFALAHEMALATESENAGGKPVWGYVNETACSAAYALASVCDRIYGPVDAIAGSIGCYVLHVDMTKAMDKNGLQVTMIRSGDLKARGGPYEGMDEQTYDKLQAWVDDTRVRFAELVAAGRRLNVKDVLATEGDWFQAADAVDLGLMDGILPEAEAWGLLEQHIQRSR